MSGGTNREDRIGPRGPHPEEAALLGGRLEGWPPARPRLWPSFETPTCGRLLRYYGAVGGQEVRIGVATTIQPRRTKTMNLAHTDTPTIEDYATVYVAFELSKAKW